MQSLPIILKVIETAADCSLRGDSAPLAMMN